MTDKKGERLALFERLEPRTEFSGGRIVPSDVLTLEEAAHAASRHAGEEVTPGDFLRAAARGEIQLHAIVHRGARTRTPGVGPIPEGAIVWLPIAACRQLAAAGRASWRAFDGKASGAWELEPEEPDFETVPDDCRVTGRDVHALADAFGALACKSEPADPAAVWAECLAEVGATYPKIAGMLGSAHTSDARKEVAALLREPFKRAVDRAAPRVLADRPDVLALWLQANPPNLLWGDDVFRAAMAPTALDDELNRLADAHIEAWAAKLLGGEPRRTEPAPSRPSAAREPVAPVPVASQPQSAQPQSVTTHRLEARRNDLDPAIDEAIRRTSNPADPAAVWTTFVAMADAADRPPPLLGVAEGEVKYLTAGGPKCISRRAFMGRLRRRAGRHAKAR